MGGHVEYQSSWLKDMWQRKVKTIVVVLDHRHLEDVSNTEKPSCTFLSCKVVTFTDSTEGSRIEAHLSKVIYATKVIVLMNKADLWMDEEAYELWERASSLDIRYSMLSVRPCMNSKKQTYLLGWTPAPLQ